MKEHDDTAHSRYIVSTMVQADMMSSMMRRKPSLVSRIVGLTKPHPQPLPAQGFRPNVRLRRVMMGLTPEPTTEELYDYLISTVSEDQHNITQLNEQIDRIGLPETLMREYDDDVLLVSLLLTRLQDHICRMHPDTTEDHDEDQE